MFSLLHTSAHSRARCGMLQTDHGPIETPVFMPVGTVGTVKALRVDQLLDEVNAQIILGNTYHLYLRPGMEILEEAGGLHGFATWPRPMLTDSGGYQVYSLSTRRKIKEEGVTFASHIDGSKHFFSPESVMTIQRQIGADIIMAFDECTPFPCEYRYAKDSMEMTHRWLARCEDQHKSSQPIYGHRQMLAPIVQGSTYRDLRVKSAEYIATFDKEVNAIGGLSVGEPAEQLYEMTGVVCDILPKSKARYLMGVGTPANILECIALGVDMFDCVLPTRNARHGLIYTSQGLVNIKNRKWANSLEPIDPAGGEFSRRHSKAYLRHLMVSKELLGAHLASLQNLQFYQQMMSDARAAIKEDRFETWKKERLQIVTHRR